MIPNQKPKWITNMFCWKQRNGKVDDHFVLQKYFARKLWWSPLDTEHAKAMEFKSLTSTICRHFVETHNEILIDKTALKIVSGKNVFAVLSSRICHFPRQQFIRLFSPFPLRSRLFARVAFYKHTQTYARTVYISTPVDLVWARRILIIIHSYWSPINFFSSNSFFTPLVQQSSVMTLGTRLIFQ